MSSTVIRSKILVCALGTAVAVLDLFLPANINFAIFYCFVIVLCAWTRSFAFLWSVAAAFVVASVAGLILAPAPIGPAFSWVDWCNRGLDIAALLLVAVFMHIRMKGFESLERETSARKRAQQALRDSEARLRLAQLGGHVGSWEWNPADGRFTVSEECYNILGLSSEDSAFAEKWMAGVHPADFEKVKETMMQCSAGEEFETEYRYRHPSRGDRWIYARGKMLTRATDEARIFGISQDVTERKLAEGFMRESQATLESLVDQRTAQLRKLSLDLMHSQDEEHRRIARELHDSFGQYLASLKINLDVLSGLSSSPSAARPAGELITDCLEIVRNCIAETRTLSHLLHPPLLDEAGFASAARWYVEEFALRSQIKVNLHLPSDLPRLDPALELAFFRALQESLTNVHRYSGTSTVDIELGIDDGSARLEVRDYGHGIPPEKMRRFREDGQGVGVGLSAMRQRMEELGGELAIASDERGTSLRATAPISKSLEVAYPVHVA